MSEQFKPINPSLSDWSEEVEKYNPQLAAELNTPRSVGLENLEKYDLPRFKRVQLPLSTFLTDPSGSTEELKTKTFYFSTLANEEGLPRYREIDLTLEQIQASLTNKVNPNEYSKYDITVAEFLKPDYGGTFITRKDGYVWEEFKEGAHMGLSSGTAKIEYTFSRDPFTKTFKYSFEDSGLREAIYQALMKIPHEGTGRTLEFMAGYYELCLIQLENNNSLIPIFIDCQTELNDHFKNLPSLDH